LKAFPKNKLKESELEHAIKQFAHDLESGQSDSGLFSPNDLMIVKNDISCRFISSQEIGSAVERNWLDKFSLLFIDFSV